jgi:hypothetical protein
LVDAPREFRAELASHPDDVRSRYHLAVTLIRERHPEEDIALLLRVVEARPDQARRRHISPSARCCLNKEKLRRQHASWGFLSSSALLPLTAITNSAVPRCLRAASRTLSASFGAPEN